MIRARLSTLLITALAAICAGLAACAGAPNTPVPAQAVTGTPSAPAPPPMPTATPASTATRIFTPTPPLTPTRTPSPTPSPTATATDTSTLGMPDAEFSPFHHLRDLAPDEVRGT